MGIPDVAASGGVSTPPLDSASGTPLNVIISSRRLVGAVTRGVDMFDCVLPTRSGRNGQAFTWAGPLNLRNARHAEDSGPLDPRCACPTCAHYSRAYLHHLQKAGEMLGAMLVTEHNLSFYQQLMQAMREAISDGQLSQFAADFRRDYCT